MKKTLGSDFFNRDTAIVAQDLLGKFLVRRIGTKEYAAVITETEAYGGHHDTASHSSKGRTLRTEPMFGKPGNFYIYLCYGMYYMLNVVTREEGYPAAVLIRGVQIENMPVLLNGPGKLTKFLSIDKALNGAKAGIPAGLWFEDRGFRVPHHSIIKTPRIGVAYAGPIWAQKKLRFLLTKKITEKGDF